MNEKLNLNELKIKSFVTSMETDFQKTVAGGASTKTVPISYNCKTTITDLRKTIPIGTSDI